MGDDGRCGLCRYPFGASGVLTPFEIIASGGSLVGRLLDLPFAAHLAIKSIVYLISILAGLSIGSLLFPDVLPSVMSGLSVENVAAAIGISVVMQLGMAFNRLLGPRVLANLFSGRYHTPVIEDRIFLFLDLVESTSIAERIGPVAFLRLLNRFVKDVTASIVVHRGEIHKYVGDEIIATWPTELGIKNARCVMAVIAAKAALDAKGDDYETEFGVRPRFRAGMHFGNAVTGEMGTVKLEIAHLGDVVNTTARIQQSCREHGQWFLVSKELIDSVRSQIPPLPTFQLKQMGEIPLRGKQGAMSLTAIEI